MKCTAKLKTTGDFGLALQQARVTQGKSQSELAEELGISQSMVSEMESGKGTIYLRRLLAMAAATGLTFTAAWGEEDAPRT